MRNKRSERFNQLLSSVCEITETKKQDILSIRKTSEVCWARNLLILCLSKEGLKPVAIQNLLHRAGWQGVGHSTVLKNIVRATNLEERDEEFKSFLNEIRSNF
jgi:chromosomal replication initiation ATPase DnaA